jgi:signal peptidase II
VSGALGNMVDRVRLGYVVDFIHFHVYDSFEWPTFNVADSTITIGVALLLLDGLRKPAEAPAGAAAPAPVPPEGSGA